MRDMEATTRRRLLFEAHQVTPTGVTPSMSSGAVPRGYEALKTLSARGKEKMKGAIAHSQNLEELQVLDRALQRGELPPDMARQLGFDAHDFVCEELESLTASGIEKIRSAIESAESLEDLNALDEALRTSVLTKSLGMKLGFTTTDFVEEAEAEYDPFDDSVEKPLPDEDYDPMNEDFHASDIEFDDIDELEEVEEFVAQGDGHIDIDLETSSSDEEKPCPPETQLLDDLAGYSSGEERRKDDRNKRRKVEDLGIDVHDKSDWFKRWLGLVNRTKAHPSFTRYVSPPERSALPVGWKRVSEPIKIVGNAVPDCRLLSLITVTVFAGDALLGFDPYHIARVILVDQDEKVVFDEHVRPTFPILDARSHAYGINTTKMIESKFSQEEVRNAVSDVIGEEETIVIGHCLNLDCMSLKLCFGPKIIDTALIFGVEGKPQSYHPLPVLASILLREAVDFEATRCPIQDAVWNMRLAKMESVKQKPTESFLGKRFPLELKLDHIPLRFAIEDPPEGQDGTQEAVKCLFPSAAQVTRIIWKLQEHDPSEWRGETIIRFASEDERDGVFDGLQAITEIFAQWRNDGEKGKGKGKGKNEGKGKGKGKKCASSETNTAPQIPVTEKSLMQAFSNFGIVVSVRIPRKPMTGANSNFGFIGFLHGEDAERAATEKFVEVSVARKSTIRVRANIAKYGNERDKRIPVRLLSTDNDLDWIHVIRR